MAKGATGTAAKMAIIAAGAAPLAAALAPLAVAAAAAAAAVLALAAGSTAVSYTHLDVYKRQRKRRPVSIRRRTGIEA